MGHFGKMTEDAKLGGAASPRPPYEMRCNLMFIDDSLRGGGLGDAALPFRHWTFRH